MNTFFRDLRYGLRVLMRAPGFATVAVLTLALGIGANTAIFTVINAVMLRMLPVEAPEQLVAVGDPSHVHSWSNGTPRTEIFSYPLYREIRDHNTVFSSVLGASRIDGVPITIEPGSAPERVESRLVTGNYFQTLGLTPFAGRFFSGTEDNTPGGDPVVVISYAYWQRRFSSDPNIVGRTVRLRNYPFTVVGVAPRGFVGEVVGDRTDLWIPMMMQAQLMPGREFLDNPNTATLLLIGRLKPGVSLEQARANIGSVVRQALTETLAAKLSSDDRKAIQNGSVNMVPQVSPGGRGLSRVRAQFSDSLLLLMGLVALVLLVACVNVANLLLARSAARRREIAVRLAIGAGPGRIVRQLLTESFLLALIGGALALLFANWGAAALVGLVNRESTIPLALNLDWRVLGFTLGICILAGILFGAAPALRALKLNLVPAIGSGARESASSARSPMGKLLIASQIALGVLVLMAAALLVRSLEKLQDTDLGYSRDQLVVARVDLLSAGYARGAEFNNATRELLTRLSALPGVRSVSASSNGLFSGSESNDAIRVEGFAAGQKNPNTDDEIGPDTFDDEIGPDYFSTIGVPIVQGREINQRDFDSGARVLVVNQAFGRFFFGAASPIGRHVVFLDSDHPEREQPFEIVGVARDVNDHDIRSRPRRRAYAPLTSADFDSPGAVNFELRVTGDPAAQIEAIRRQIRSLNPNLRGDVHTAGQLVEDTLQSQVLVAKLSAFFGGLVLLLVCIGLYGSMSYNVAGRIKEIGVRMALGARRWDVVWMVTREACYMLAVGIAVGIPAGILASRLFKALLYDVGKADPVSIAAAILTLLAVAVAAAVIPARRATRVDPMIALRYE